jgi:2-isopropylmalate synthase
VVKERFARTGMEPVALGIHAHNDGGVAVANSIAAVEHGFTHVQGCFNGYGARCGCADLSTIIPNLELKAGCITVGRERLEELTTVARFVAETANLPLPAHRPFVGAEAGGGSQVGNADNALLARVGHAAIPDGARRDALDMARLKEEEGYDFACADGSFELIVREALDPSARPFTVLKYEVTTRHGADGVHSSAEVTLECGEAVLNASAEGNGPVNALDRALRFALSTVYGSVDAVKLVDYKVRVLESEHGTDARCRVLIHWTDGARHWNTAGVSDNIVEASWLALVDAVSLEVSRAQTDDVMATSSVRDYSWAV